MSLILLIGFLFLPIFGFGADNGPLPEPLKLKFSTTGQPNTLDAVLPFKDHGKRYEAVFEEAPERTAMKIEEKGLFNSHLIYALPEDPNVTGFAPESGIRWMKYEVKQNQKSFLSFSSSSETETHPVVFVVRRLMGENKVWITVIGFDGETLKTLLNVKCDHYEMKDFKNDGHEDVICYYQYKIPDLFSYPPSIADNQQADDILGNAGLAYRSSGRFVAGFYDEAQKQLDQAVALKTAADKTALYFDYIQLRDIDNAKMSLAGDKQALQKDAEKEARLAEKLQPMAAFSKTRKNARFYPFLLKRLVFNPNGKGHFKAYQLNTTGELILMPKNSGEPNGDDARRLSKLDKGFFAESPISHSGHYKIKLYVDPMNMNTAGPLGWLMVDDVMKGSVDKIKIPDEGYNWKVVGWHPIKDLFYFSMVQGPHSDQNESLWQYSPVKKSFLKIGITNGKVYLSPDLKWILWGTSGEYQTIGKKTVLGFRLNEFDVNKGINYELTPKVSENMFIGWAK